MRFEYFILLGICAAGPLVFSFSNKLAFYKTPSRLIYSIIFPFIAFIVWDVFAVSRGHWGFGYKYITGIFVFELPVEEILFFIVIPFAGLFTWEVIKYFSEKKK